VTEQLDGLGADLDRVLAMRPQDPQACVEVLERAVRACRSDPAAGQRWVEAELLDELVDCYEAAGRFDHAITAMRRALQVGWSGAPDGRCRIAELLMRSGRVAQAAPIWQQVKADTPDDVWVYNNAGLEYADIGDHEQALSWLTQGLRVALDSMDPEQLVGQLSELRQQQLTSLGRLSDQLQAEAATFLADPPPRPAQYFQLPAPAPIAWDEGAGPGSQTAADAAAAAALWPRGGDHSTAATPPESSARPGESAVLAWFPDREYQAALTRWPELAEEGPARGAADHAAYNRAVQRILGEFADGGLTRLQVAPIRIDEFLPWCQQHAEDPATSQARAAYAPNLARRGKPAVLAWPSGRNQRCWCGSGRKYKQCCGSART